MKDCKIEDRYLKFCYEFRAVIRCMRPAFYRRDYQKTLIVSFDQKTRASICFKTCSRAFETLSRAFEALGQAVEGLREN